MRKKRNKTVSNEMTRALRGTSERERVLHRLHSVVLVLNGLSSSAVARLYGDSARSVAYWVKRFELEGLSGLEEEARSGRPRTLTNAQMRRVGAYVEKAKGDKITAKEVSFFINQKFRVQLTVRQCRRILNGISGKRSRNSTQIQT